MYYIKWGDITTEFTGVKLDGADFFNIGGSYTGKLVNEEGYKLPSDIKIYTVYPDGYKVEMINNPYQTFFTYNSTTGEIDIVMHQLEQIIRFLL